MSPRTAEENAKIKAATRQRILASGLRVFALKGFHAAGISDIAREAALSHGLIYHYFASKDEVFIELVRTALETSFGAVRAAARGPGSAWDKIRRITAMLYENAIAGESPYYFYLVVQASLLAPAFPALAALLGKRLPEYNRLLEPLIRKAQREGRAAPGDAQKLAASYWALVQGLALSVFPDANARALTGPDIMLNLLRKRSEP